MFSRKGLHLEDRVPETLTGRIHQELRRKGGTLTLSWEEYQATFAGRQALPLYAVLRALQDVRETPEAHNAADSPHRREAFRRLRWFYLPLITVRRAHIFAAAMSASSYTFACATPVETDAVEVKDR
jgi:hypothetical protein